MGVNMKKIFFIISIIILLGMTYLIIMNLTNVQPVHFSITEVRETLFPVVGNPRTIRFVGHTAYIYKSINLAVLIAAVALCGIIAGAGSVYMFLSNANSKIKAYKRELEKSAVTGQNNASRVDVLEAKIQTLEKAFNTVIDERTKLELEIQSLNTELEKFNNQNKNN